MSVSIKNRIRKLAEKHWIKRNLGISSMSKKEFIKIFEIAYNVAITDIKKRQWINVKDELPKKDGEYLIYHKHGNEWYVSEAVYDADKEHFSEPYYGQDIVSDYELITHWSKKPEPPDIGYN